MQVLSDKRREGLPAQILIETAQIVNWRQSDFDQAKRIADFLLQHYPRYGWAVRLDSAQGVILIRLPAIPGHERFAARYAYVVKLAEFYCDPNWDCIKRAGGELLERFGLPRDGFRHERWREAKAAFSDIKDKSLVAPRRREVRLIGPDGRPLARDNKGRYLTYGAA